MDMSGFKVAITELNRKNNLSKEEEERAEEKIKELKKEIKDIKEERKLSRDETQQRKDGIAAAKKIFGEDQEGSMEHILGTMIAPEDDPIKKNEKEIKRLEKEKSQRPTSPTLEERERAVWAYLLPVSYRDTFSRKAISQFPHKMPRIIVEENGEDTDLWKILNDAHVFETYEIRASQEDPYRLYYALFGYRGEKCWLIAHWSGIQGQLPLSNKELKERCLLLLTGLQNWKICALIATISGIVLGTLSLLSIPSGNWFGTSISGGLAVLLIALALAWRQELDSPFSPKEERELFAYLQQTP